MRPRVAAVAAVLVTAAAAAPSYAVQTEKFSLTTGDSRTALVHAPGDGVVEDTFVVGNRTDEPITLALDVIGETEQPDGTFDPGPPGAGLAADVTLETRSVRLDADEQRTLTVTIDRPSSIEDNRWAAITVTLASPDGERGGFGVTEQLALLVGITTDAPPEPGDPGSESDVARWVAVAIAVLLVAVLLVVGGAAWARRRRTA